MSRKTKALDATTTADAGRAMGTAEETLKCPVCQDFFTDPVTLPCGHDFCLTCIQAVWETDGPNEGPLFCPECQAHALLHQQRSALREHTLVDVTEDPLSLKCREHREERKLFCMEDRVPVCCLCVLKSAADFRERLSDKYSRIRFVLDGDERLMMQIIDAEETYMTEWLEAQRGIVEDQIKEIDKLRASSRSLLQETNDLQFLQQITTQNRCDPLDLKPIQKVDKDLCDKEKLRTVEKLVDDLSVALSQHFPRMWSYLSSPVLDSNTAHPKVEISQDRKQVYWRQQPVSEALNQQPYDSQYSVMTQESFTTGQHYWEVIVQDKPYWLIGVTTGPIDKKDGPSPNSSRLCVNNTSWCIYYGDGQYLVCHDTQEKQLSVGKRCTEPLYLILNPCIDVNGLNRQPLTILWIKDP
ncbi:E3 ubiquitin-protein ligase TRIM39-like [Antennarius striatus]|uniref:E3 ubiquitin-protein ligase TRIM39-like n=1 Tax=Antennarius striatus TaxID=241820 RepID=UPI0035AF8458